MATDSTGLAGPHPDLRPLLIDALEAMRTEVTQHPDQESSSSGLPIPANPDSVTVRCQRTWYDIRVPSPESRDERL
jgi:hypothetical protein